MTDDSVSEVVRDVDPLDNYRSPRRLAITVTIALSGCVIALIAVMTVRSAAWRLTASLNRGHDVSEDQMELVLNRLELANQILLGLSWIAVVLFLIAIYRFAANARLLTKGRISTPASAVVWFFVPVLNLFMPYMVLQQIWRASSPFAGRWPGNASSVLLRRWWALWLLSIALVGAERYMRIQIDSLSDLQFVLAIAFTRNATNLALVASSIVILGRLVTMQEERYANCRLSVSKSCPSCGDIFHPGDAGCPVCGHAVA